MLFDAIVVPRGAEAQAVKLGWSEPRPVLLSVPAGDTAGAALRAGQPLAAVLVLGLCGALDPVLRVGETVVYGQLADAFDPIELDAQLAAECAAALGGVPQTAVAVRAVISDVRVKAELRATTRAAVIDMECVAIARALQRRGARVAMVRVVSDDATHALPDLGEIYNATGGLRPLSLAAALWRNPLRGGRFVVNAIVALQALRTTASRLSKRELDVRIDRAQSM